MSARYLDATNDVAFKKLFNNKERLISLLNAILQLKEGSKIIDLDYVPQEQMPIFKDGKRSIFDLKVQDEARRWYIIEMQRKTAQSYLDRVQFYGSYSYINQIESGINHHKLLPVIVISILGEKLFPDDVPCINYHKLKESNTNKQYLYSLTYVFVELGKFNSDKIETDIDAWLHLLKYAHNETEPPKSIANQNVLSAYSDLEKYKWTASEHDAYIRAKLAIEAEDIKIEENYKKIVEAEQKGREEGREKGEKEKAIKIATNLLKQNLSDSVISTATGLSVTQITNLRDKL